MSKISYGWQNNIILILDGIIDFLVSWIVSGYEIIFKFVGVVGSSYDYGCIYQNYRIRKEVLSSLIWSASLLILKYIFQLNIILIIITSINHFLVVTFVGRDIASFIFVFGSSLWMNSYEGYSWRQIPSPVSPQKHPLLPSL